MHLTVVDTDVFSFLLKNDSLARLYETALAEAQPCLSFQTLAEVELWVLTRAWGAARRRGLDVVLRHYLTFPYDQAMMRLWAEVTAHRRRLGRPIGCGDAWIAATALRHDAELLTHNARDYRDIPGLRLMIHDP